MLFETQKNISKYIKSFASSRYKQKNSDYGLFIEHFPKLSINENNILEIFKLGNFDKIMIEIGCGCGDFLINYAKNNQNSLCIGCDVYKGGILTTIRKILSNKCTNIFLFNDDARLLIDNLPNNLINEIYILFPDPWPKRKHNQRRIINKEYINILLNKISKDAVIITGTDVLDYQNNIRDIFTSFKDFVIFEEILENEIKNKIEYLWYEKTKYHEKANLEGRNAIFFKIIKK